MILREANILLMWCLLLFYFYFFFPPRLGKPSAAYSSRLTSDILTSTSGFFYMYIELCFMYFNCVLVVEIFYCLFLGFCCLWRFFFLFNFKNHKKRKQNLTSYYNVDTDVKRKEADACKYSCTHAVAEKRSQFLSFSFFFL